MTNSYAYVKTSVARRVAFIRSLKDAPCVRCGARLDPDRMHWHHIDPTTKEFSLAKGSWRVGRSRLLAEIEKCELLCANCHIAEHRPRCGTRSAYAGGCRCERCRQANREYRRTRRRAVA